MDYICSMKQTKIIHVHLIGKRLDYYFGSIAAIYTTLTPGQVGASHNYLLHAGLSGGGTIITRKAIIKQSYLITAPKINR